MFATTRLTQTFPSVCLPSHSGGLAVEVSLIATLGHGAGNHLFASVAARQQAHQAFVDELDEPSARLGGTDFDKGDATSLYSFVVGPQGHPFHRHAGHRVFTAVSGSGGAQLRFSSASPQQIEHDPHAFIDALHHIDIPPDSLFSVRFGGDTWHQFAPLQSPSRHPVFFALSCHTNELGGALSDELKAQVLANQANIPALTELLPESVLALMRQADFTHVRVPTTALSLDAPPGSLHSGLCLTARGGAGLLRGAWANRRRAGGYWATHGAALAVSELAEPPIGSLLLDQLNDRPFHHQDMFRLSLNAAPWAGLGATESLARVLEGFLCNPPTGVSRMMAIRNLLVRPLGLRRSPLGCPVSSLLSKDRCNLFAGRYPVLEQRRDLEDQWAQVLLGADDKHLLFRSCVAVRIIDGTRVEVTLGTRVRCRNLFGHFYLAAIDRVHRAYVTPSMLRLAVEHATQAGTPAAGGFSLATGAAPNAVPLAP
ncbi:MAG: DUF2867 domain-containing protein [Pseudomonas sp.]|uniref:DUF2867 domain-containing protein n=1 Tax=Pseudomonas sp. TaxID=306 RepID=UPI0033962155